MDPATWISAFAPRDIALASAVVDPRTNPHVDPPTLERAIRATLLARALRQVGWFNHQHSTCATRVEAQSQPFVGPLCRETHAALRRVQTLVDEHTSSPQPSLRLPFSAWPADQQGRLKLQFASDARPREFSPTYSNPDNATPLWAAVVLELASGWAYCSVPRSVGRCFMGPRSRFLFWPKELNTMLAHIDIAYGRLHDLFVILTSLGLKVDLKSAYRALSLSPDDEQYHGAVIDGVGVIFQRISFGMGQSPAMFVKSLAVTLDRFRGSMPQTIAALSSFVDDCALGATSALATVLCGERLLTDALRSDGWWVSSTKSFFYPARVLLYIGFLIDFGRRSIRIAPEKAAKLRALILSITCPSDALLAQGDSIPVRNPATPTLRLALFLRLNTHLAAPPKAA